MWQYIWILKASVCARSLVSKSFAPLQLHPLSLKLLKIWGGGGECQQSEKLISTVKMEQ